MPISRYVRPLPPTLNPQVRPGPVVLSHDRPKDHAIPADAPHPFLIKIGFQTEEGRVRAGMAVSGLRDMRCRARVQGG